MSYIAAKDVLSPKANLHLVRVLLDPGPSKVAYACAFWDGRPVLLTRWNGNDANPIGMPQSRGISTWFVIGDDLYPFLIPYFERVAPMHVEFLKGFMTLAKQAA